MIETDIPGYTYGTDAVPRSPVSLDELQLLQATLLLGEDDRAALRRSGDLLAPQVEAILDVWYGFVGANPHLLAAFTGPDGHPTRRIWPPCGVGSGAGFSTPPGPSSTKPGLTTSRRSAYATPAGARTALTPSKLPTISPCATSSPCSSRLRPPSSHFWPTVGPPRMRLRPCTRPGSRPCCSR